MQISYTTNKKKFRKVYFLSGNATTGNRVPLDPKDFSEMQDIWLEQLDNFVRAIRGSDAGIVDGCDVMVQAKEDGTGFEVIVANGTFYVNSTMAQILQAHALDIPTPDWQGVKTFYFIAKPVIRTFIPTVIGEPGFSVLAGRPTSNRAEIAFDLELVEELPEDWHVLLCELRVNESVTSINDIELILSGRNILMNMKSIQDAAVYAKAMLDEHLVFYFDKQDLVGEIDGVNNVFRTKYPLLSNTTVEIYVNNELLAPESYTVTTTDLWDTTHEAPVTEIVFNSIPAEDTILQASYYPEQHVQYLSKFRFAEHLGAASEDHDNRYYTEAEIDAWRVEHNADETAHPTHVLWTDFEEWKGLHTSAASTDHDNVYSRLGHGHTIDDVELLRNQIVNLSEQIGYGDAAYYTITQMITSGVDGINRIFPITHSLLDNGVGFVKQVRADITNDAIKNPAVLTVIDAAEDFASPSVGAFSEPKMLSQRFVNANPTACAQLDDEIWAIWAAKESESDSRIYFASYAPGNGFFSPATSPTLLCNPDSKVACTVVHSVNPTVNQRVVIVWNYDNMLYYSHIDKGQTEWRNAMALPETDGALDVSVCWVNDGVTSAGRLHVLYVKEAPTTGKKAIYRRIYEIDMLEVEGDKAITFGDINTGSPVIVQDRSADKKVWYGWVSRDEDVFSGDYDNSCSLRFMIVDKYSPTVYQEATVLAGIKNLNIGSSLTFVPHATGIYALYTAYEANQYGIYYNDFDFWGNPVGTPIYLEAGHRASGAVSGDGSLWVIYQYLSSIYFRAREAGAGEVKWNIATQELEFERAPVSIPIYVDIAIPIQSLNKRVSALESTAADNEELMAQQIRDVITSMGLNIPQERINAMREKMIVEAGIEVDSRRIALEYDKALYNKFFDATDGIPDGIHPVVLKGGSAGLFIHSGLVHDKMGKLYNPTNKIIKIYTRVYNDGFVNTSGRLRVEVHGDLECLAVRLTSGMTETPLDASVYWLPIADGQMFTELNYSGNINYMANNNYGLEIEILPGGWIYDWVVFMKS
jgi:hypothetical protein